MGNLTSDNPPVPPKTTQSVASMPQSEETNVSNLFLVSKILDNKKDFSSKNFSGTKPRALKFELVANFQISKS